MPKLFFEKAQAEEKEIEMDVINGLFDGLEFLVDHGIGKALIFSGGVAVGASFTTGTGQLDVKYAAAGLALATIGYVIDWRREQYARWETTTETTTDSDNSKAFYDAARAEQRKGIHTV